MSELAARVVGWLTKGGPLTAGELAILCEDPGGLNEPPSAQLIEAIGQLVDAGAVEWCRCGRVHLQPGDRCRFCQRDARLSA